VSSRAQNHGCIMVVLSCSASLYQVYPFHSTLAVDVIFMSFRVAGVHASACSKITNICDIVRSDIAALCWLNW
jgi:hypothetical protein